ncbi:MAG: hypothetical protein JSW54_02085 [Fidelibacterota bacterium]|nr:MAG: hypothetical protein JSW54_02085 [Candidatus Neomarinimicrobiota bacterium]
MKTTRISTLLPLLLLGLFVACNNSSTESQEWDGQFQLAQVNGCQSGSLGKASVGDSLFSYEFEDDLLIDFRVSGNCCPETDRFELSHAIVSKSITITVADTAADLCLCTCPYTIHTEFYDMPEDMYVVTVVTDDGEVLHEEDVWRIF